MPCINGVCRGKVDPKDRLPPCDCVYPLRTPRSACLALTLTLTLILTLTLTLKLTPLTCIVLMPRKRSRANRYRAEPPSESNA